MTAEQEVASILDYLRSLAPDFFSARMRGASDVDIQRLEQAAGTRMSDGHREFLRHAGATPAQLLNPFLNDRDYCVDTLVAEYEGWRAAGQALPPGIVYFSSSDITGENLFLRHAEDFAEDPEIGDLGEDFRTFIPNDRRRFASYLAWFARIFRTGQFDHAVDIGPRWNAEENRWEGEPAKLRSLLDGLGFEPRFAIADGSEELDGEAMVATCYPNGSVLVAGDDFGALMRLGNALMLELKVTLRVIENHERLRSPRR